MNKPVTYLPAERIIAATRGEAPRNPNVNGYGNKIPTPFTVTLDDKRTRRVYAIRYSNAGSAYVRVGGDRLVIDFAAEDRIEELAKAALQVVST